jgi:S-adenosylmethionine hydrolase
LEPGDNISIAIFNDGEVVLTQTLPYFPTFGRVPVGEPLLYLNSLNNVSLAINQGNYSETFDVKSGASWSIRIEK